MVVGCWVSSLENPCIRIAINVTMKWQPGTATDCAALQIDKGYEPHARLSG